MNEEQRKSVVHTFKQTIEKATTKYRREHLFHPTGEEFALCWAAAIVEANPAIVVERQPGRPKQTDNEKTSPMKDNKCELRELPPQYRPKRAY